MKCVSRTSTILAALVAIVFTSTAVAQDGAQTPTDTLSKAAKSQQKKARFAEQEQTYQKQSRSSASGSPRVDKTIQAADPVPKATNKQEKKALFTEQEATYQQRSRSSAAGSPRVDKSVVAADPVPKATTPTEKKARFTATEKELQQNSKP